MINIFAPVTHILPFTTIRRDRVLPVDGRVLVRKGQKVNASDIVAEANLHPEHLLLDIARGLGVSAEEADRNLQCQAGMEVGEKDILAGPVGMGRRVVRSPRAGKVVLAGEGQVLLEVESQPYELRAGFSGVVEELIGERGVVIVATGALVQSVWGNGRIDFGLLNVKIHAPEDQVSPDMLDVSLRGSVVLAGHCADAGVLSAADELPLRGLILASMDSALISAARKVRCPVVVVEGFGRLPFDPLAFKLLTTSERREVSVKAESWDRYANSRPEVIIPLPAEGLLSPPPLTDLFAVGQQVRVVNSPYRMQVGAITALRSELVTMPSGLRAPTAEVRFEDNNTAMIPLVNLEILE